MFVFRRINRFVLDSSSIIDGRVIHLFERRFFDGKILIPVLVSDIVRKHAGSKGDRAIRILERTMPVEFINHKSNGLVEEVCVLDIAQRKKAKVFTTSDEVCRHSKYFPKVDIIDIRDLYRVLTPIFEPHKRIAVKILKRGLHHNEGIGYIEGVKIVVDGAGKMIGQTIAARVNTMLSFDTGNLVFCSLENKPANRPSHHNNHPGRRRRHG